ncbi:MAG: hypothetical protein HC945_04530, partial [Nitrosarchaeum sp.]|nr:hypothetical protein [Nitrosarchaeum sp.]
ATCDATYLQSIGAYNNEPTNPQNPQCLLECASQDQATLPPDSIIPKESCRNGMIEACTSGAMQGDTTKTCAAQGASTCSDDQVCIQGTLIAASNTETCCAQGTCSTPDNQASCAAQHGRICQEHEACAGTLFTAADTNTCCSGECILSPTAPGEIIPINTSYISYITRSRDTLAECCGSGACTNSNLIPHPYSSLDNQERHVFSLGVALQSVASFDVRDPATNRIIDYVQVYPDVQAHQVKRVKGFISPAHDWTGLASLHLDIAYTQALTPGAKIQLLNKDGRHHPLHTSRRHHHRRKGTGAMASCYHRPDRHPQARCRLPPSRERRDRQQLRDRQHLPRPGAERTGEQQEPLVQRTPARMDP